MGVRYQLVTTVRQGLIHYSYRYPAFVEGVSGVWEFEKGGRPLCIPC